MTSYTPIWGGESKTIMMPATRDFQKQMQAHVGWSEKGFDKIDSNRIWAFRSLGDGSYKNINYRTEDGHKLGGYRVREWHDCWKWVKPNKTGEEVESYLVSKYGENPSLPPGFSRSTTQALSYNITVYARQCLHVNENRVDGVIGLDRNEPLPTPPTKRTTTFRVKPLSSPLAASEENSERSSESSYNNPAESDHLTMQSNSVFKDNLEILLANKNTFEVFQFLDTQDWPSLSSVEQITLLAAIKEKMHSKLGPDCKLESDTLMSMMEEKYNLPRQSLFKPDAYKDLEASFVPEHGSQVRTSETTYGE